VRKICQKALALAVSLFVSFPAPVLATLQQQFEDNLKAGWLAEKFSVPICGRFFEADDPALRIPHCGPGTREAGTIFGDVVAASGLDRLLLLMVMRRVLEGHGWTRGVKKTPDEVCRDHSIFFPEYREILCRELSRLQYYSVRPPATIAGQLDALSVTIWVEDAGWENPPRSMVVGQSVSTLIYLRRIFEEEGWARGVKKTPEEVCRDHAGGPHEKGNLTRQAICWEVSQMGY